MNQTLTSIMISCKDKHRVLLVIDNVSTSLEKIEQAKSYLKAEYAPNSVVLVATRSLGTLQSLNIDEANCFEMPKLEDEEARSLFLYHAAPNYEVDEELLERCMVSVKQFFAGVNDNNNYHYHPIALKEFGLQLGFRPDQWEEKLTEWTKHQPIELFGWRKSFDMLTPDSRPSFLRQSFNMLELEDQLFYMDVALFYPEPPEHGSTLKQLNIFKWLSLLEGLKTKWLLEHLGDGSTRIGMHPLACDLCESEANGGELASRRWIYNDAEMFEEHVLPEHGAWKCMQRISLRGSGFRKELNLKYCTDVLVLKLVRCHIESHVLDLTPLTLLKSLEILSCTSSVSESSPVQVRGLGLLRNLLVLKWDDMPSGPLCIEEIGLLTKLQILELDSRDSENTLPDVGRLCLLREATFRFGYGPDTISGLSGTMNTLRILDLGGCHRLLSCDGVGQLVALEELDLSDCLELEKLPNLQNLTNLKKLDISGCRSITELPGLDELGWALRDLNLCDCSLLRKLPYLGKLKNLRKLEMRGCFAVEELLGLGHCWALEELDLQGCSKLRRFDDQLGNLCHLRKVDISDCCLVESVPGLNDLICLQEFRAERCSGLVELPDLRKLSNLLVLNINLER